MACELVDINASGGCEFVEGGILFSYVTDEAQISSVTVVSGVISNFTMATTGQWKLYTYDDDGTALYEQPGTRNGDQITFAQRAFMKFKGITSAYVDAGNKSIKCCNVVLIHFLSNGVKLVQGLELQSGASKGYVKTKVLGTRIVPSMTTGTTQDATGANMSFSVEGTSRSLSVTTSLTDTAIEAL